MTSSSRLTELISLDLRKEKNYAKSEIATHDNFSAVFDGSTRLGKALATVVRVIDNQWFIQQRLVKLEVSTKNMNAEELTQRLIQRLAV